MLYEFTLSPGIFEKDLITSNDHIARDLVRFFEGLQQNGLIGNLCDGELRRAIGQKLASLPSGPLRDELRLSLEILDKRQRFVARPFVGPIWPDDDGTWFDEAINSHTEENFYSIVTTELTANGKPCPSCTVTIGSLANSSLWQDRRNSWPVERQASVFRQILRPVLRNAKSLMLIDPHIRPSQPRYCRSLRELVKTAYERIEPSTLKVFEIHVRMPDSTFDWFHNDLRSCIGSSIPVGSQVRLVIWEDPEKRFHNRFILTNFCGISIDKGLDESDSGPDYEIGKSSMNGTAKTCGIDSGLLLRQPTDLLPTRV